MSANVIATRVGKTIAVALALVVVAYVIWAFYRVYVYGPREHGHNEVDFSWSRAIFMSVIVMTAVATVSLSRLVIQRISGRRSSSRVIYLLAAPLVIVPIPIAPISPTTMVFSIVSILLLFLNLLFGRSSKPVTTTGDLIPEVGADGAFS